MMRSMQTHSLEEFQNAAIEFAKTLASGANATVVALSGDLGAGKTTFVQAIARHFGVIESVTSPTFVILQNYSLPDETQGFLRLIHMDAYRLKDESELGALRFTDYLADPQNLILIEWPERISRSIPSDAKTITLTYISESERELVFN